MKKDFVSFCKTGIFSQCHFKTIDRFFCCPFWIFFVRTLDRLGKGVRVAAKDALFSQEATKETKARVFGFNRSLILQVPLLGPLLHWCFFYFIPGNYKTLFYIAFIPGIISVLLIFFLKEKKQPFHIGKRKFFFFL